MGGAARGIWRVGILSSFSRPGLRVLRALVEECSPRFCRLFRLVVAVRHRQLVSAVDRVGERVKVVRSAKRGLDTAASHQALGLSLHLRDRGGGGSRDLLDQRPGYRRSGRREIRRVRVGLLWMICQRRLCLRGPGVCECQVVVQGRPKLTSTMCLTFSRDIPLC